MRLHVAPPTKRSPLPTSSNSGVALHDVPLSPRRRHVLPTPMDVSALRRHLAGYYAHLYYFLLVGFTRGFRIPSSLLSDPAKGSYQNHKSVSDNPSAVRDKLVAERGFGRIAGPFLSPPFHNLILSPLAIVPKRDPGEFRLLHDLSFHKHNSVNSHIPRDFTTVQFELLDTCIERILEIGVGCQVAKADLKDAFRIIPVCPLDYHLLGFTFQNQFYFDMCLPMGCSVSCQIFEALSCALQWICINKFRVSSMSHILDDFIFFGPPHSGQCQFNLDAFFTLCRSLKLPVKHAKTVLPTSAPTLHGIVVDTCAQTLTLPTDKLTPLVQRLHVLSRRKKVCLRDLLSVIGSLTLACRAIAPGRAFLRRLHDLTCGISNPNHKVRLTREARNDLTAWLEFFHVFNGTLSFLPVDWTSSDVLNLFSDASGFAFSAVFRDAWLQGIFPDTQHDDHISVKELLPIVLAVRVWSHLLRDSRILFFTDNTAVVEVINKQTSKHPPLMLLVRQLVVTCLQFNIAFRATHIPGKHNQLADMISRLQMDSARGLRPSLDAEPTTFPTHWLPWEPVQ